MTDIIARLLFRGRALELPSSREVAQFAACYVGAVVLAFGFTFLSGYWA
jgi:hypothetical protein